MKAKKAGNIKAAEKSPVLTTREQEIFGFLLAGSTPIEIANTLNISHNTVLTHQKNLYRKLGVHNYNSLIAKYSNTSETHQDKKISKKETAVNFSRWQTFKDDLGSFTIITENKEFIQEQHLIINTIEGQLSYNNFSYTGIIAEPDTASLEAMQKMSSFSFMVLGDGKTYEVMITTTDTRVNGGLNHYRKNFCAKENEITKVTINVNDLLQSKYYGNQVPFIISNAEAFQIQPFSSGNFKLKIWNIKFIE